MIPLVHALICLYDGFQNMEHLTRAASESISIHDHVVIPEMETFRLATRALSIKRWAIGLVWFSYIPACY